MDAEGREGLRPIVKQGAYLADSICRIATEMREQLCRTCEKSCPIRAYGGGSPLSFSVARQQWQQKTTIKQWHLLSLKCTSHTPSAI